MLPINTPESTNITVVVERQKGTVGKVTVTWAIYKVGTSQVATEDFITPSGSLIFKERESEKVNRDPLYFAMVTELPYKNTENLKSLATL